MQSRLDRPVRVGVHHLSAPADTGSEPSEYVVEQPTTTPDGYIDECLRAASAWRANVFWPGRELTAVAARLGEFAARGVRVMSCGSPDTLALVADKLAFGEAVQQAGMLSPWTFKFNDAEGFEEAYRRIASLGESMCFKPRHGIYGRGFRVVKDRLDIFEELFADPSYRIDLEDARRRFSSVPNFRDMLAMTWLSGTEWSVDCFRSREGANFLGIARAKLAPNTQSLSPVHETVELARRLADTLQLRGLFNCQFKYHRGRAFVLEVNGRPAGGIALTAHSGANLVELALRDAMGLPLVGYEPGELRAIRATAISSWTVRTEDRADAPARTQTREGPDEPGPQQQADVIVANLPNGRAVIRGIGGGWRARQLLGVAARRGSSRPFLLVSRVLGKHLPVTPYRMETAHRALVKRLAPDLPGPVLFVGLAETATGLGWGVFEQWRAETGRRDGIYLHTTRYTDNRHRWLGFDEVHSHAPKQAICAPSDTLSSAECQRARTLVVVDDELTSGRTAHALGQALSSSGVPLERFVAVGLVGAFPDSVVAERGVLHGWNVEVLGRVAVEFEPAGEEDSAASFQQGLTTLQVGLGAQGWGRFGAKEPPRLPQDLFGRALEAAASCDVLTLVASGECMYPAQMLGRALEKVGHRVLLQSTTRSPVSLGGEIRHTLPCVDPLGSAAPYFIHNPPAAGSGVVILHEPGAEQEARPLALALGGTTLEVWDA